MIHFTGPARTIRQNPGTRSLSEATAHPAPQATTPQQQDRTSNTRHTPRPSRPSHHVVRHPTAEVVRGHGEIPGIGPVDPWLARDLARAAARNPKTTWCVTVTDDQGHAVGHGCARPEPKSDARRRDKPGKHGPPDGPGPPRGTSDTAEPGFSFTGASQHGPPGGYGTWRLSTGVGGRPDLLVALDPISTQDCDHRYQAKGHDPGVKLRHLTQIRYATCTGPGCRRPSAQADFEHNIAYEAGGRTCLCNGGPKCRLDHRLKQDPRWKVDQLPDGTFRWITPTGRQYDTEPTRYPV